MAFGFSRGGTPFGQQRWLQPVNPNAKRPTSFFIPFRLEWKPRSRDFFNRMHKLDHRWPQAVEKRWKSRVNRETLPLIRRAFREKGYDHTGRSIKSFKLIGSWSTGSGLKGLSLSKKFTSDVHVSFGPNPDWIEDSPQFGKWAHTPFSIPTALEHGIKKHWVWIRRGGLHRPRLERWARQHGLKGPKDPSKNWAIRVYHRPRGGGHLAGRKKSAVGQFALMARSEAFAHVYANDIAEALDDALR
jgi:hypothetical protein